MFDKVPSQITCDIIQALRQAVRDGGYSMPEKCFVPKTLTASVRSWMSDLKLISRDGSLTQKGFSEGCRLCG